MKVRHRGTQPASGSCPARTENVVEEERQVNVRTLYKSVGFRFIQIRPFEISDKVALDG